MLVHIQIRDFVLIDSLELELGPGLTVLTGETGAGKSILVDALMLVSGSRAGAEVVRHGSERAEVTATFLVKDNPNAAAWFKEQDLNFDDECTLRRIVTADGRSRAYVNGQAIAVQALRQLGEALVDIHGQMEFQSLMKRPAQRMLLDQFAGHESLVAEVAAAWRHWKSLRERRAAAQAASQDRAARLELLRYHVSELKALDLKIGEVPELLTERARLAQSGRLTQGAQEAIQALREADASAEHVLARMLVSLRPLSMIDTKLEPAVRSLDESLIALREAIDSLVRYASDLEADPARQEWLENRLAAIEAIARKHRVDATALPERLQTLTEELHALENLDTALENLDAQVSAAEHTLRTAAERLSQSRAAAAKALAERVTASMQGLGMPGGRFSVALSERAIEAAGEAGVDDVEFLVSANPGQPLQPLAKTASGGELSRISLSIQVAALETLRQPCLVFDEVDAGIGGGVAEIVGRHLRALGNSTWGKANRHRAQVLCVTHLPQVASQAHAHIRVSKLTDGKTTRTALHVLTYDERVEEIARMLGGVKITATARQHAVEMLNAATETKLKRQ